MAKTQTRENEMTATPTTIKIDDVTYVREDAVDAPAQNAEGLRYAIVRSRDQGVMAGFVESVEGRQVTLLRARQLWRWSSRFVLTDLAEFGPTDKWECKFSCEASQPTVMLEACGILYCTEAAASAIRAEGAQVND